MRLSSGRKIEFALSKSNFLKIVKKVEIGGLMKINEQLLSALLAALEWIDAVPSDTVLPAMPGFDRDEVNELIANARKELQTETN
ncbi:TPA: hypothetical protein MIC13_22445 [Klebsiella pneumoniae]|nr:MULTISPECIES: hypothetical protein [Klebsiella]MBQ5031525.1 hypothetical protein [Klebsiella pneumoniae]OXV00499.1 hypothetical protein CEB49_14500 [Klebsiella pneumoniae]QDJ79871.1 hypothetical protein CI667_0025430 [Klebsiella pneumoniae subsp. pneumoniae]QWB49112.1 hypothetical protein IM758_25865 [Klebsiella pneumoniae subsp. pneumoniae]TNJ68616.1 hypothetical protein CI666_026245 [Klebsiella pneumoniae subsp. pneumoniae]